MSRPNSGPRLVIVKKRGCNRAVYYIRWTEAGRTRERSTGESELGSAQEIFGQWLLQQGDARGSGPRGAAETLIADVLSDYARERGAHTVAPERIGYAIDRLVEYWGDRTMDTVRPETCRRYWRERGVSDGTVRRELGALRAAINHAVKEGRSTAPPVPRPASRRRPAYPVGSRTGGGCV